MDMMSTLMKSGFIVVPAVAVVVIVVVGLWYKNPINSTRLRWTATRCLVRLLENYGGNFVCIDAFLVPLTKDIFERNDKSYIMDMQRAIFDAKGRGYLYYDVDSALPLTTEKQGTAILHKLEEGELVVKATPSGAPVVTLKKDEQGRPLLWFDPSYIDAKLFNVRYKAAVWGQVLSGVFQKYALYIIIGLIVGIVAVIAISFWQINQLTNKIAELAARIAEMAAGGGVIGG